MCNTGIMSQFCVIISIGIALSFAAYASAVARCFQFTWLGHRYNNESIYQNATCMDATRLSGGVPCVQPLVVSHDGSWPDVDYIWRNYPDASCILASNDVCAQYTYYFDGHAENSTYFCTQAVSNLGDAITSGCHEQVNGSYVTRVCFCRSVDGGMPCNNGIMPAVNYFTIILISLAAILQINVSKI